MNAHERMTLHRMIEWLTQVQADPEQYELSRVLPGVPFSTESALLTLKAVEADIEDTRPQFQIDLECGCTLQVFRLTPPQIITRQDHPAEACDQKRLKLVPMV
jgi:hypothetical protein